MGATFSERIIFIVFEIGKMMFNFKFMLHVPVDLSFMGIAVRL